MAANPFLAVTGQAAPHGILALHLVGGPDGCRLALIIGQAVLSIPMDSLQGCTILYPLVRTRQDSGESLSFTGFLLLRRTHWPRIQFIDAIDMKDIIRKTPLNANLLEEHSI